MKHSRLLMALVLIAAASTPAMAQLEGTIEVVGEYKPQIIVRERIHTIPQKTEWQITDAVPNYSSDGIATQQQPSFLPLPALGWKAQRTSDRSRGYFDVGLGSWLQSNVSAGYRFIDNEQTTVGAMLQFNSTSLYKPYDYVCARRGLYDGTLGVYANHTFNGLMNLDGAIYYRHADFNYYEPGIKYSETSQSINAIDFKAMASSLPGKLWQWHGGLRVGYFGYGHMLTYVPNYMIVKDDGEKETRLGLDGEVRRIISDESSVELGLKGDAFFYNVPENVLHIGNYGNLSLHPAYIYNSSNFNTRIGLDMEFTFNGRLFGQRFSLFHIAPEVSAAYRNDIFNASVSVTGGNELQGMSELQQLDYYCLPLVTFTAPVWKPVDIKARIGAGPFKGISFGIHGGWKMEKNRFLGGWYMNWLSTLKPFYPYGCINIKGFNVGVDASAKIGSFLRLNADLDYQHQNGETGYFNGYDRPRWVLATQAVVTPIKPLQVSLGYEYRGVRNIWCYSADGGYAATRLPDLAILTLGGNYALNSTMNVHADLAVPFGKQMIFPSQPVGGCNFMVGFSMKF